MTEEELNDVLAALDRGIALLKKDIESRDSKFARNKLCGLNDAKEILKNKSFRRSYCSKAK